MRLTVIIPTFNRKETLKTTLLSLSGQTFKDFDVIVADDGSTDGTKEMVSALQVPYPIKHLWQKNAGRSAARNMGLAQSSGEIILFIDDHIIVDKRLIEEHVITHDRFKDAGVKVVRGRVEFIETAAEAPKTTDYISQERIKSPSWENEPIRMFITNNISVEKKAILSVFGFDEDFKEYGLQDAEMGYRLKAAGYRFKINPNAVGYIFGVGWTLEDRLKRRRQVGRSSVLFYRKHPALLVKVNLSIHCMTLAIQRLLSLFEPHLPDRLKMFYNLSTGIKEGLEIYKDPYFSRFHGRFKGEKKVVLFVSHLSDLSGAPISLYLIVKNINRDKYFPIVAVPGKGPLLDRLEAAGISYQIYKDKPIYKLFPSLKIHQMIKDRQADLVYLNTSVSIWAAKPARRLKVPVISHIREDLRGINNWLIRKKIIKWSDRIILISKWMNTFIRSEKTEVVHNTVDLAEFNGLHPERIRKEFNLKGPLLLFVGTLEERKGVKYLIKAFPKIKTSFTNIKLLIVGKPLPGQQGYQKGLKQIVKDPDLRFIGSRSDVYDIMAACDLMIVPSLSEAFGRVIIEAMSCKKPVIATNVGGIPEIIDDGKTGILIGPKSLDAIARETTLLLKNKEKMKSMGLAGRKKVEEQFTIAHQIKEIEGILDEHLKG